MSPQKAKKMKVSLGCQRHRQHFPKKPFLLHDFLLWRLTPARLLFFLPIRAASSA
jgi:hypothetical protein